MTGEEVEYVSVASEIYDADLETLVFGDIIPIIGEHAVTYSGLFSKYADSEHGRYHASQAPRYSQRHGFERPRMLQLLGDDVDPLRHGSYTEQIITRPFLWTQNATEDDYERFTPIQIVAARIGALVHDLGENEHSKFIEMFGGVAGDPVAGEKTDRQRELEHKIRNYILDKDWDALPPGLRRASEDMITRGGNDSLLIDAFEAIERIGFYTTALKAGNLVLNSCTCEYPQNGLVTRDEHRQLLTLALLVSSQQRALLEPMASRFPYVAHIIESTRSEYRFIMGEHEYPDFEDIEFASRSDT